MAIVVEVAGILHMPAGPWIATGIELAQDARAAHRPDVRLAIGVLPQDVGPVVAIEVVGRYECGGGGDERRCRLGRIENDLHAIAGMNSVEPRDSGPVYAIGGAVLIDLQD